MCEEEPLNNTNVKKEDFICGVIEGFYGRPWTSEQRKDLFQKLRKWGMNAYVYAPKDDSKHRANWRDLYTVEEAEHLSSLISVANENCITFYYALSPGLDITYSSAKEILTLKRKLEQVSQFGCSAFALLFDDIEPEMSEADKEVFQSFAHAQVSVTNDVYQHLNQPKFLICPTQYCSARAVPNVQNSEYLNTLGSKLAPDIGIMWTGGKVISRSLTVEGIDEVSNILKRPPVIWDNLHANDYDQKRVFLGPYQGRPPDLIPRLRGVLSNPNCEFWANFVAIHTLAQWSRCTSDVAPSVSDDSICSDIKLETETEDGVDITSRLPVNMYHSGRALRNAIVEWLPEFSKTKQASGFIMKPQVVGSLAPVIAPIAPIVPVVTTCLALTAPTTTATPQMATLTAVCSTVNGNTSPIVMNSLLSENKVCTEPMDCNPPETSKCGAAESAGDVDVYTKPETDSPASSTMVVDSSSPDQSEQSLSDNLADWGTIGVEDLNLLCDLFYLPFEHGTQGVFLLHEFYWLYTNAYLLSHYSSDNSEVEEWHERAGKLELMSKNLDVLFQKLNNINNKELMYELYPYVWEIRSVVSTLNSYVKWLGQGKICNLAENTFVGNYTWFSKGWKESFMSGDQEPWVFRGGLTADLQRLIPVEGGGDLFVYKIPRVVSTTVYTIRQYDLCDKDRVLSLSKDTVEGPPDASKFHFDVVSRLLNLQPDMCFVVEEDDPSLKNMKTVVGFTIGFVNMKQHRKDGEDKEMDDVLDSLFFGWKSHAPSLVTCGILSSVPDQSVVKRLMLCVFAALQANGSCGAYTCVDNTSLLDFYSKLGFIEQNKEGSIIYLNRIF